MQRREVELKSRLDLAGLARKALRLLRADVASSTGSEPFAESPILIHHDQREVRSALLNVERKKALALMEWQQRRSIY